MMVTEPQVIKLAILAVGGQGGGVLTNWITDLARAEGWRAQSTVVAGVAQRTGATIYYVEMAPDTGRAPVFALAPAPGDVDILIAAEWMEAGRAVMRGFVTPDRTTVIASTHRMFSIAEKVVPGDGRASDVPVAGALDAAAARVIAFDMEAPAAAAGSVISATLFGALAGSRTLPFAQDAFEAIIRAGGRGVEPSLAAFRAGLAGAPASAETPAALPAATATGPAQALTAWQALEARVADMPEPVRAMTCAGLVKVVDFQDPAYGSEYLDLVDRVSALDTRPGKVLTVEAAKHLANAMAYDDVIRVADAKTRASRFERIETEMGAAGQVMRLTEYFHPRIEEICGTLPARVGRWIESRPKLHGWLGRRIDKGRRVSSNGLFGFLALYLVAGLRRWRRGTLRHARERAHRDRWLALALETSTHDYDLAVEILRCRRLIKGYSDTHARGQSKFDRTLGALELLSGRADAADWLRRLREAALQDEQGEALDGALRTVASFSEAPAA